MARCGHAPMLTAVPVGRFGVQNPEIPVQVDLDTGAVGPGDQHAVGGGAFAGPGAGRQAVGPGRGAAPARHITHLDVEPVGAQQPSQYRPQVRVGATTMSREYRPMTVSRLS